MATVGVKGLNLKEFVHRSSELYFCVAFRCCLLRKAAWQPWAV